MIWDWFYYERTWNRLSQRANQVQTDYSSAGLSRNIGNWFDLLNISLHWGMWDSLRIHLRIFAINAMHVSLVLK